MVFEQARAARTELVDRGASRGKDYNTRDPEKQAELYSYLRMGVTAVFQFLEAYLNGIAYDFFQRFHDELTLKEHDLLAEWDSAKKCTRFVPFNAKVARYPKVCARLLGEHLSVEQTAEAILISTKGKLLRDSLMHPSPYVDPKTKRPEKFTRFVAVSVTGFRELLDAADGYVHVVERGLGRKPEQTVPWMFRHHEQFGP